MSGIVLFQVRSSPNNQENGFYLELYEKISENNKSILNFSSSGFVKDNHVITCTTDFPLFLSPSDIQILYVQGVLENPKVIASFYFNSNNSWIPLELTKAVPIKDIEEYTSERYALLYFKSKYKLPREHRENNIYSSPLGLLSLNLYLNHKHPVVECFQVKWNCKVVKFSCFPGSEGAYCAGDVIIPSNIPGYSLAYMLPKL